jgi:glutamate racemase
MIGIFDSGISGLLLLEKLKSLLPDCPFIYYGDSAFAPYGAKPPEVISERSRKGCDFLINHGAKIIVLACHTTSAVVGHTIHRHLSVPVIEMVQPVAKEAIEASTGRRLGVIGTKTTIESGAYQTALKRLDDTCIVHAQGCPLLVPLIEEGWRNKRETKMILRRYLRPIKLVQVDTLIPACNHYQLIYSLIRPRIGKKVQLIDPFATLAAEISSHAFLENLSVSESVGRQRQRFFVTSRTEHLEKSANYYFNQPLELTQV